MLGIKSRKRAPFQLQHLKVTNSNFYLMFGDGGCHPRASSERCLSLRRWPQEGGPNRQFGRAVGRSLFVAEPCVYIVIFTHAYLPYAWGRGSRPTTLQALSEESCIGKGAQHGERAPSNSSSSMTRQERQGRGWPRGPTHVRLPHPPSLSLAAHLTARGGVQARPPSLDLTPRVLPGTLRLMGRKSARSARCLSRTL